MMISVFFLYLAALALAKVNSEEPITTYDVFAQTGEVGKQSAVVNLRCNSEKNSFVRINIAEADFRGGVNFPEYDVEGYAVEANDFTASIKLHNLAVNTKYEYRVTCDAIDGSGLLESRRNSFWTAPEDSDAVDFSFVWVADLAGQGWGRNPELSIISAITNEEIKGGYVIFETMRQLKPDFAIFQGDLIYADGNIPATKQIPAAIGGGTWINDPSLDIVAKTIDEFRMNWKYNYGDKHMASFLEEVPTYAQWDDHEVHNNWYPGENLTDSPYSDMPQVHSLAAFYEYNALEEGEKIYRTVRYGKHLEIFLVDYRSYRGPNDLAQTSEDLVDMMGPEQLEWLKQALLDSDATWKLLSSTDPIGIITGGPGDRDSFGQGDPRAIGRELELVDLFGFIKENDIKNFHSLTSDVHFSAVISYDPARATGFTDFKPFYEFCIGPIHAGAFGPSDLDTSFGPEYVYVDGPTLVDPTWANFPPPYFSSFGYINVDKFGVLTVYIVNSSGEIQWYSDFEPEV